MRFASFVCLVFLGIAGCSTESKNTSKTTAIEDISSMSLRSDGNFDVTCRDGRTMVVTADDVRRDQVCKGNTDTRGECFKEAYGEIGDETVAQMACVGGTSAKTVRACLRSAYSTLPGSGIETYRMAAVACSHNSNSDSIGSCISSTYSKLPGSGADTANEAARACSASIDGTTVPSCVGMLYATISGSGIETGRVAVTACRGTRDPEGVKSCVQENYSRLPGSGLETYRRAAEICSALP